MALNAHFRGRRVIEHMFVLGPMGGMAARARDRDVSISRINDLFSNGVRLVLLIVMTGPAQLDLGCLREKKHAVRRVRRMARCAESVLHRHVFRVSPFLPLYGICVALAAEIDQGGLQKRCFLRRMGTVAMETPCLVRNRPMDPVLVEGVVDHIIVTTFAQFQSFPSGRKRIR
jgi:hypothetical protein